MSKKFSIVSLSASDLHGINTIEFKFHEEELGSYVRSSGQTSEELYDEVYSACVDLVLFGSDPNLFLSGIEIYLVE